MARELAASGYRFNLYARLLPLSEVEFRDWLDLSIREHPKRRFHNQVPHGIPSRFWAYLLDGIEIPEALTLAELGKKHKNRLVETVLNHRFAVEGKSAFKEEFVTAGGFALDDLQPGTMESRHWPGLYFAGEVLDIDGITGGFNFQAAWTTAYFAGTEAAASLL
jgi:predicted Rossmann fold flavoprotein